MYERARRVSEPPSKGEHGRERERGTHVGVDEAVVVRDERDRADERDDDGAAPRDARPQERAHDAKQGRVRREREDEADRDLVLRLVLLERAARRVARKRVDGEVNDEREEEEGKAREAREGAEEDRAEDAEPGRGRVRDVWVERGGEGERREREVREAGRVEGVAVGVEEAAEAAERPGRLGGRKEVDEAVRRRGWRK